MSVAPTRERYTRDTVLLALASGATYVEAADRADINEKTVRRWMKSDPKFAKAVDNLQDQRLALASQRLLDLAPKAALELDKVLGNDDVRWRDRIKAVAEVLDRVGMGRKGELVLSGGVNITGQIDHRHAVLVIDPDRLSVEEHRTLVMLMDKAKPAEVIDAG